MKRQIAAVTAAAAAALLAAGQAEATVVFNWVQTGTPSVTNPYKPFAVSVSDDVYLAALSQPVTFGVYSARLGVEQSDPGYLSAQLGSPDVRAAVYVRTDATGAAQIVPITEGLSTCNSAPWYALTCRVGFASSAVEVDAAFTNYFTWGGGLQYTSGRQSSSFTLSGNALSVRYSFVNGVGDGPTITTDDTGSGYFTYVSEYAPTSLHGAGYWEVDASTIPSAVPLPPSAALMGLGLFGIAAATRRQRRQRRRA